ncbi:MAG: Spy/CpxP family protein refolding chaperone [Thermodesulfobacteriota bacterium]|jgi:Spy/CpxP family protein refolding chaperone|nr:MAG: Spy/CpxP family protein refolding chaperone [Thermodesulfobacteriota bacterium]
MKKIVLSLLLIVIFALPAFSQIMDKPTHEGHHGQMMGMCNMDMMGNMMDMCLANADKIGLTDEQINKITPIHREMQKKQARFIADQKISQIELMEIMDVKDFDLGKANAAVKKIADIKTAHHLEMLKSMQEVRTILTDDQFKKMKNMMSMETSKKEPTKNVMKKQQ